MFASFYIYFLSVVVQDSELMTLRNLPPLGLVQTIWDWKGTFLRLLISISKNFKSSSSLTSYSKEILVLVVALANCLIKMVLLSFKEFTSSFLKTRALWRMTLVSTFKPTTSSLRMLAKSSESFSGFTTLIFPFVASITLLKIYSFELSPLMVMMLTATFFNLASFAIWSQNSYLLSSAPSREPTPILASPSVQSTTTDPLLPLDATQMAETKAGPRAVCPLASALLSWLSKRSQFSTREVVNLKLLKASMMLPTLLSLSPTMCILSAFPSPTIVTSLLKRMKPTFL